MKQKILKYALLIGMVVIVVAATVLTIHYVLTEVAENTTSLPETSSSILETTSSTEKTTSFQEEATSSTEESTSNTEPHKHSFGEWIVTKEATCTVDGEQERSCSCGKKETQTINSKGHVILTVSAKLPTCTELGFTEKQMCSVCQTVLKQSEKRTRLG